MDRRATNLDNPANGLANSPGLRHFNPDRTVSSGAA